MAEQPGTRFLFVGGKGGVGKTTIAAAIAIARARAGEPCLVVSTDPAHSLGDVLDRQIGSRARTVEDRLQAQELDPEALADAHIDSVAQTLKAYVHPDQYPDVDRQMALARQAPGTVEAALVERLAGMLTEPEEHHQCIIFDTAPSGHTLRLLQMPGALGQWSESLIAARQDHSRLAASAGQAEAVAERDRRILQRLQRRHRLLAGAGRILSDPARTSVVGVLTPERLPIVETGRMLDQLQAASIRVSGLVINRVLPESADGEFLRARREQQALRLDEIDRRFSRLPRFRVPLEARDPSGPEALAALGGVLGPLAFEKT